MRNSVRGVLFAAGCALVALGGWGVCSADSAARATPAVVTAHPPLEAVPAAPGAHAQQSRLRRCAATARTKHLTGAARESYVKSCTAARHSAPAHASPAHVSPAQSPQSAH